MISNESLPTVQLRFIVANYERIVEKHTILAGAGDLQPGTVMARDSDNGNKLVVVDSQSATESIKQPFAILANTYSVGASDVAGRVFVKGYFQQSGLIFGGTDTADDHRDALREKSIFIRNDTGS